MPTVSPQLLVQSSLRSVTKDAKFAQLSPASQDAILKASQSSNPTEGLANNPELQGALAEARQKGFLSNDPLWMALGKALAITGGAALTAGALGGLSGAAGTLTATSKVSATGEIAPALAPSLTIPTAEANAALAGTAAGGGAANPSGRGGRACCGAAVPSCGGAAAGRRASRCGISFSRWYR